MLCIHNVNQLNIYQINNQTIITLHPYMSNKPTMTKLLKSF